MKMGSVKKWDSATTTKRTTTSKKNSYLFSLSSSIYISSSLLTENSYRLRLTIMKHTRLSLFVFFYPQIDYLLKTQVCTSLHPGVQSRWQNLSRPWQGSLQDLPGTLTHLSALAAESSHSLLAPLGTHATIDVEEHRDSDPLLDTKVSEAASGKLLALAHEADEISREEGLVLNLCLESFDRSILGHSVSCGAPRRVFHEYLHFEGTSGCSKPSLASSQQRE
mmetsp:Transcript_23534/g.37200  ORF Transcript_23534/g.37200 Transcript_23534/m.37200 type:complete len:222 (+) Transcript_23534:467-1132(+)